jgi:hypothetical protein
MVIATNTEPKACDATLHVPQFPSGARVRVLGEDREVGTKSGGWREHFGAYGVHVYLLGDDPERR